MQLQATLFCAVAALVGGLPILSAYGQLPAFPGAEGFGRFATGGRAGTVYHVNNLNDNGAGSFRDAVSQPNRTVVFDVGGIIQIGSRISVAPNITIAGQTAPGDGITIYGNGLSFSGAHNTIARFIRVRQGINGDSGTDAVTMTGNSHDMIFDHLSVSWGRDETFSVSSDSAPYPTNITIQSTIISQGLQTHSAGGLIQTPGGVSVLRCLYIDNDTRNPKFKFNSEYVNNVVYGWETAAYIMGGDSAGDSYANAFNNYFINGANGGGAAFSGGNANFHIYATNNWQDANQDGVLNGSEIPFVNYGPMDLKTTPYPYPITNALPPLTALKLAVSDVGASWKRDNVDERMILELTSYGTLGETIKNEYEYPMNGPGVVLNGTPYTDTDQDGMPDFWENDTGSNPAVPNNNDPSPSGSGYTRLEDYLNWLAEPHGIALTNQTCDIELRQFTRGFTNTSPVYSVTNATNGTVSLVSGGQRARFVPTPGYNGPAGFTFTVTDADGSAITRRMNLFFTPSAQSFTSVWRGDYATNRWNTDGDYNWFNNQSLLFPFHAAGSVLFDDTGSTAPAVNLVGPLQPALVTFDSTQSYSFSGGGSLVGAMALNKTGTGTLALNNTNTFSGPTTVSNGTLLVNGSLPQSVVTVRSGGTLGGHGSVGLAPNLQSGARIAPGGGIGSPGTLTFSNDLTSPHGVTYRFDMSDDPTGTVKTNDQIIVNGTLAVTGTNYIRVTLLDGPLLDGVYTLFQYTNFSGNISNFVLINANGVLTNPPGQIAIHVHNVRIPATLKWVGNGVNNNWDNGTTTNWLNNGTPDVFYFFDSPIFDNSGSTNPAVNLIGALTPQSTTFAATNNYTLAGSGRISGYGPLVKTNSGTLTILATNDYAGQTVLGGGVLSIAQLPNASVPGPIGVVEEDMDNLFFTGGTLRFTGGSTSTDRKLTMGPQGGTVEISSAATTLTLSNAINGSGTLNKTGAGRLDCAAPGSYTGGTIIRDGSMRLGNDSGFGSGVLTLNGTTSPATLQFGINGGTLNNTLNIVGTNNFTVNNVNNTVKTLTGSGTLTLNTGTTFTFEGNMAGFSGTIKVGTLTNPRFFPSTGSPDATFDLGNTSALLNTRNGGLTIQIGALIGGPNTQLQGASQAVNQGVPTTYVIGGKNLDTTFAGRITEVIPARTVAISKVGTGKLILSGASTYTGGTTVHDGTLLVNNTTGTGTGTNSVIVNDGGTLGGTGIILGPVTINPGGAIAPGASIGTLSLRSNLTLSASSILRFELGPTGASDRLLVTNALVLNGTLHVTNVAGFGSGTYTLINYGGTLSGPGLTVGSKPAGYSCIVSTATAKQVQLIVTVQTQPVIKNVLASGGNVILAGTGPTNGPYYVLTSTNVALPVANWQRIYTNQFDGAGNFLFTNPVPPGSSRSFYLLEVP